MTVKNQDLDYLNSSSISIVESSKYVDINNISFQSKFTLDSNQNLSEEEVNVNSELNKIEGEIQKDLKLYDFKSLLDIEDKILETKKIIDNFKKIEALGQVSFHEEILKKYNDILNNFNKSLDLQESKKQLQDNKKAKEKKLLHEKINNQLAYYELTKVEDLITAIDVTKTFLNSNIKIKRQNKINLLSRELEDLKEMKVWADTLRLIEKDKKKLLNLFLADLAKERKIISLKELEDKIKILTNEVEDFTNKQKLVIAKEKSIELKQLREFLNEANSL